jgi:hypothetical protein
MFSPIRRKRRFPALIAAALFSSFLMGPTAFAGPNGGNTVKFMAQQGMQYHANTRQEAQRRQAAEAQARRQEEQEAQRVATAAMESGQQ